MTSIPPTYQHDVRDRGAQLRALNNEYRDTQEALNHAEASLNRAKKLMEENYQRKRKQILNHVNGEECK
jgi:uncharacterized protein YlxW (UPF0749 family)